MGAIHFSLHKALAETLVSTLPLRVLYESGTYNADTVMSLHALFDKVITVEISLPLYTRCLNRLKHINTVEIVNGSSPVVLSERAEALKNKNVLYWLDAHWCCAENVGGEKSKCVLIEELTAMGSISDDSVIVIDDARLFIAPPLPPYDASEWPMFQDILDLLKLVGPKHELIIVNDYIVCYPKKLRATMIAYAREHGSDLEMLSNQYDIELQSIVQAKEKMIQQLKAALDIEIDKNNQHKELLGLKSENTSSFSIIKACRSKIMKLKLYPPIPMMFTKLFRRVKKY